MAHLVGLNAALSARRKFVDEAGEVSIAVAEGTGTGSGGGGGGGNLFQGGMHKSTTGFVGLVNQGATCYLNSLLQTLYMLPEFRRALLLWRYDASRHGEEDRCLSRQLQRLFAHLQLSKRAAVTTGGLTKSFGCAPLANVLFEALHLISRPGTARSSQPRDPARGGADPEICVSVIP